MKVLIIGDVHLEHSVRSARNRDKAISSLVIEVVAQHVKEVDPDVLFVTGDLFDEFGVINSSLASWVKGQFVAMGKRENGKRRTIVFVAGNHDYESLNENSYGGSVVTALFGHMEDLNIYTADRSAKTIEVDGLKILGIPYRETLEEFEKDCLPEILRLKESGQKAVVGWHVGLPFGEDCWRGDEDENGWIVESHPHVKALFDVTLGNTVYCSHYHGPATVRTSLGQFVYVGSPATRSKSESGQVKRTVLLDTETMEWRGIPTNMHLDVLVSNVDEAIAHIESMKERFGDSVEEILNVHVRLQDGASLDEYSLTKSLATQKSTAIKVEKPIISRKTKFEELIQKLEIEAKDVGMNGELTKKIELEMARLSVIEHFRGKEFDVPFDDLHKCLQGDLKAMVEILENGYASESGVAYLEEELPKIEGGPDLLKILQTTTKRGGTILDKAPIAIRLIETKKTMDYLADMVC